MWCPRDFYTQDQCTLVRFRMGEGCAFFSQSGRRVLIQVKRQRGRCDIRKGTRGSGTSRCASSQTPSRAQAWRFPPFSSCGCYSIIFKLTQTCTTVHSVLITCHVLGPELKDAGVGQVSALGERSLVRRPTEHSTNPRPCVRCLKQEQEPALQGEGAKPVKVGGGEASGRRNRPR